MQSVGLSQDVVHAVAGDLFDKSVPSPSAFSGPEWHDFDLATVGFGFHHFEDVVHSARQLKQRLRPGGVLVINDFLEGGDWLADEEGKLIEGTQGNHAVHSHNHGHGDKDNHSHAHHHHHHHHHEHDDKHAKQEDPNKSNKSHSLTNTSTDLTQQMTASIVVPHFTLDGVQQFFTQAGFVDVHVFPLKERSYMEFGGKKLWRTILIAKGRRPLEGEREEDEEKENKEGAAKSEL